MGDQVEGHAKHNAAAHRCKEEEVESKASGRLQRRQQRRIKRRLAVVSQQHPEISDGGVRQVPADDYGIVVARTAADDECTNS